MPIVAIDAAVCCCLKASLAGVFEGQSAVRQVAGDQHLAQRVAGKTCRHRLAFQVLDRLDRAVLLDDQAVVPGHEARHHAQIGIRLVVDDHLALHEVVQLGHVRHAELDIAAIHQRRVLRRAGHRLRAHLQALVRHHLRDAR
jgi:hypothetical protein